MDSRNGYLLEHRYSNVQIIDETEKQREFPQHIHTIGPLHVWREDVIPRDDRKDRKVTYYRLQKVEEKEYTYVAVLTDYDQNLSSLSIETTRKQADPESQRRLTKIYLYLSFVLNIFLIVQQGLSPEEQIILNITPENAGWLIAVFAMLKIVDLMQERPAVFCALYVQYWAKVYNPSAGELVDVAFCSLYLTDKLRVSDTLPVAIENEHVLVHSNNRKRAEDKFEAEYQERVNLERNLEDMKRAGKESEVRAQIREKQAYVHGLKDAQQSILKKSAPRDFLQTYPSVGWPIAGIVIAVVFYFTVKNLAVSFPEAIFIVDIAQFPLIFWVLLFVLGFLTIRWFFRLFEVR